MLRYVIAANTLKLFSRSESTRRAYRALGNTLGGRKRAKCLMPKSYFMRLKNFLHLNRRYGILKDGDKLLELGTGWLHWDAIVARLFFDIECVLFDVWDNRQMCGLQNYIAQLDDMIEDIDVDYIQRNRAHSLIAEIRKKNSFKELYDFLGFRYVVDPSGKLTQLNCESFDVIVSTGVLEHIHVSILPEFVNDIAKLLKPGGFSLQNINLRDHLQLYDRMVSEKQYLSYSDRSWKRWFENDVQYINRVQRREWKALFKAAGLELYEEKNYRNEQISYMHLAKQYQKYDKAELECVGLKLLYRKPER